MPTRQPQYRQPTGRVYRLVSLNPTLPVAEIVETPANRAFLSELGRMGFVEGKNLVIERYSGGFENYQQMIADVTRSRPDVILVATLNFVLELKVQTTEIPIVAMILDPLDLGIVPSVARPGGNITGVYVGFEIWGKRLGLLKEAIPKLSRVGLLIARTPLGERGTKALKEASERADITLVGSPVDRPFDDAAFRGAFAALIQDGAEAVYVGDQAETYAKRELIVELAEKYRVPAIYPYRAFVELGGLMAHETDLIEKYTHAADAIAEILNGTKPQDVPFYQATKYDLTINLKTAKALDIEIPNSILAQADEVIE